MQYEGQNLFNKYFKKKTKKQKTTGQQMTFKKIAFCKHQNFFSQLPISLAFGLSDLPVLMIERSTVILHASLPESGLHTACHPAASPPKSFFEEHIFRIWQLSSLKEREMA